MLSNFISNAQCDSFAMSFDVSQPTCYNFSDGNIDVTTTGGLEPIYGEITNENGIIVDGGKKTFLLIGGGWYYIYVIDANGCELFDSVYLINPAEMIAQINFTNPSSLAACDGVAEVDSVLNYQGDFANIGYYWSPGGPLGIGQNIKNDLCNDYYNLVINDEFGCSIVEQLTIGSASSGSNISDEMIRVFPNPTNNNQTLNIELNQSTNVTIQLIDINGKLIQEIFSGELTETNSDFQISFEELPSGIYFYSIVLEDGIVCRQKAIKN